MNIIKQEEIIMARLVINGGTDYECAVNGKCTVVREKDAEGNIVISGWLVTHTYIEEINSISADNFICTGVNVVGETFGSNAFNILYNFVCNDFDPIDCLSQDEIDQIEAKLYEVKEGNTRDFE